MLDHAEHAYLVQAYANSAKITGNLDLQETFFIVCVFLKLFYKIRWLNWDI
jgi:hypothetical protein